MCRLKSSVILNRKDAYYSTSEKFLEILRSNVKYKK